MISLPSVSLLHVFSFARCMMTPDVDIAK